MDAPHGLRLIANPKCEVTEGPFWHDGRLWWVDIPPGRLHSSAGDGSGHRSWALGDMLGAVIPAHGGGFIALLRTGWATLRLDAERAVLGPVHVPAGLPEDGRFNDGKADAAGRVWGGTMIVDPPRRAGRSALYRIGLDGVSTQMLDGMTVANGLDWSLDGRTFYHIDSPSRVIRAFPFDAKAGTLGAPRELFRLPEGQGVPDGCCLDAEGHLWVGCWDGHRVLRIHGQTGALLSELPVPVRRPSSCCFGGPDLATLYITAAGRDDSHPWAGGVLACEPGVRGLPGRLARLP